MNNCITEIEPRLVPPNLAHAIDTAVLKSFGLDVVLDAIRVSGDRVARLMPKRSASFTGRIVADRRSLVDLADRSYPMPGYRPIWVARLLDAIKRSRVAGALVDLDLPTEAFIQVTDVLQGLLGSPENRGPYRIERFHVLAHDGYLAMVVSQTNVISKTFDETIEAIRMNEGNLVVA